MVYSKTGVRLWNLDDVSRVSIVTTQTKYTVGIHSPKLGNRIVITEVEIYNYIVLWSKDGWSFGHEFRRFAAGTIRPATGACISAIKWQFIALVPARKSLSIRPINWKLFTGADQKNWSTLIKPFTSSLLAGITYGLEGFCIFPNQETKRTDDAEFAKKVWDYIVCLPKAF